MCTLSLKMIPRPNEWNECVMLACVRLIRWTVRLTWTNLFLSWIFDDESTGRDLYTSSNHLSFSLSLLSPSLSVDKNSFCFYAIQLHYVNQPNFMGFVYFVYFVYFAFINWLIYSKLVSCGVYVLQLSELRVFGFSDIT